VGLGNPRGRTALQNDDDAAVSVVTEGSRAGQEQYLDFCLIHGIDVEVVEQLASDRGPIVDGNRSYPEISGRSPSQPFDAPGEPQTSLQVCHIRAVTPVFGPRCMGWMPQMKALGVRLNALKMHAGATESKTQIVVFAAPADEPLVEAVDQLKVPTPHTEEPP